jgi:hypothetical protein
MIASVASFLGPTKGDCSSCSGMEAEDGETPSRLEEVTGRLPRERFDFPWGCGSEDENGLDNSGASRASSIPSPLKAIEIEWVFLWEVGGTALYGPFFFLAVGLGVREGPADTGEALSAGK